MVPSLPEVASLFALGLVWGQHHLQVNHPQYLPLILLFAMMTLASVLSFGSGFWHVVDALEETFWKGAGKQIAAHGTNPVR